MQLLIRNYRLLRGWSLQKLSEESGVSISFLSDVENGKKDITVGKLCKVALALDCTLEDLVKYRNNE